VSKRTAVSSPASMRGRIVGEDVDISCPHEHATAENAKTCAKLALRYMRYRESLGTALLRPAGWAPSLDLPAGEDIEPDLLLAELEGRK
jgi:hypothetical protein